MLPHGSNKGGINPPGLGKRNARRKAVNGNPFVLLNTTAGAKLSSPHRV